MSSDSGCRSTGNDLGGQDARGSAPDLSWVYLQHTDDIGHRDGDGPSMDLAVRWVDARVSGFGRGSGTKPAIFRRGWLVIVTTDHGRTSSNGKGHGGQSDKAHNLDRKQ